MRFGAGEGWSSSVFWRGNQATTGKPCASMTFLLLLASDSDGGRKPVRVLEFIRLDGLLPQHGFGNVVYAVEQAMAAVLIDRKCERPFIAANDALFQVDGQD